MDEGIIRAFHTVEASACLYSGESEEFLCGVVLLVTCELDLAS